MDLMEKYIYLDNAAAAKTDDEVVKAMLPFFTEKYAVASSQFSHQPGIIAGEALELSRNLIAARIGAKFDEIIFTSDAAESNNLAIKGYAFKNRDKGDHIITTQLEVYSVLNSCKTLEKEGFRVTYLPVNENGIVNLDELKKAVTEKTILISVQWANQETGTIQPIGEIAKFAAEKGIAFHTDATVAFGKVDIDLKKIPVSFLTAQSNSIHGPKGVALLYVRKGTPIKKMTDGGFMEFDMRAGVENIPGIVGFAKAVEIYSPEKIVILKKLEEKLLSGLLKIEESDLNGSLQPRVPGMINISFYRAEGEAVILHLDMKGIGVITGSACFSRSLEPSYVLMAMGHTHERAHGSIRYSLSHYNTEAQMDTVIAATKEVVEKLRKMSPLKKGSF